MRRTHALLCYLRICTSFVSKASTSRRISSPRIMIPSSLVSRCLSSLFKTRIEGPPTTVKVRPAG